MGVELAIWRWRVGCQGFPQYRGGPAQSNQQPSLNVSSTVRACRRSLVLSLKLLLLMVVISGAQPQIAGNTRYAVGSPVNNVACESSTLVNVVPLGMNSSVLSIPCVVPPCGPCHASVTMCVLMDARHTSLLSQSLLIRSGIEQNPGPPKPVQLSQGQGVATRQMTIDAAGNLASDHLGAGAQRSRQENSQPTLSDIMSELRIIRTELRDDINKVKDDVNQHTTDIQQILLKQTELEEANKALLQKVSNLEKAQPQGECSDLRKKVTQLEDNSRRNNIIVGGLPQTGPESWETTEANFKDSLVNTLAMDRDEVESLQIDRAQRLGKRGNGNKIVKVVFANNKDKLKVLKKAREVKPESLYYREDFAPSTLEARSRLKPGLLAVREKNFQAFLAQDKLIVQHEFNKNVYRYDQVTESVTAVSHTFDDSIQWPAAADHTVHTDHR